MSSASQPIVVGVDGSRAALNARWAVVEAAYCDAPLRLVHAVPTGGQHAPRTRQALSVG